MKKLRLPLTMLFALASNLIFAQSSETIRNYIAFYKDIAMEEMQRTGVPAAITLAQGIHETGAGTSKLVRSSNNHFGIKCKSEWKGEKVYHDDDARGECFRKYDNPFDSYRDHSDFLKYRPYYTSLFDLDPTDYKAWAHGLKKAGYATNPKYAQILIKIIETYNLQDYTLIAMGKKPLTGDEENPVVWASNRNEASEAAIAATPLVQKTAPVYPQGKFRINETPVVFVPKGTAFLKIADEHNLSLARLFDFNDMQPMEIAEEDMLVYLQRKRKTGATAYHIVAEGETLFQVAQLEGIRLNNLMEYNSLKNDMQPAAGEKLYLQSPASREEEEKKTGHIRQSNKGEAINGPVETVLHTVQPKETMYAIAKKYAVTVEELMAWNQMQSIDLRTGQQLRINKKTADATN